eukprot:Phypoly_transcript_11437.p1 GENE.Phypoly_transcript_11437~~Phypoly_transcript_11437.p1  ORF type:complete len:334 (+),score=30.01 Phypoly_transcript_11437:162-1163(+)
MDLETKLCSGERRCTSFLFCLSFFVLLTYLLYLPLVPCSLSLLSCFFVYFWMEITQLPQDILVLVGGYLKRGELFSFSLLCHSLCKIANEDSLWRNLYMYDYGGLASGLASEAWKARYHARYIARANDISAFNANPTVLPGLAELQNEPPYNIERFTLQFLQEHGVSRVARGIYLSLTDARMSGLLGSYFDTLDFSNQTVLESLSMLLNFVQFPSHFSVITKFMLFFSERYFACNYRDTIFKNSDAVYVLAFGIIMLNTDMHNSAVKNKMTLSQYIHNSSGINNGENLPEKLLADIYSKVKEQPLVFNKSTPTNQYESSVWSWVSDWIGKLKK